MAVLIFLDMVVLPKSFVGDMYTPTAEGDDGVDVGLERVAYRYDLFGFYVVIEA